MDINIINLLLFVKKIIILLGVGLLGVVLILRPINNNDGLNKFQLTIFSMVMLIILDVLFIHFIHWSF